MKLIQDIMKLEIPNFEDRNRIVRALANSGYPCWIAEEKDENRLAGWKYFVLFDTKQRKIVDD